MSDKRRVNASKLSRKLFSKPPQIESVIKQPLKKYNISKDKLGDVKEFKPLRSDIAPYKLREGEDIMSRNLYIDSIEKGVNEKPPNMDVIIHHQHYRGGGWREPKTYDYSDLRHYKQRQIDLGIRDEKVEEQYGVTRRGFYYHSLDVKKSNLKEGDFEDYKRMMLSSDAKLPFSITSDKRNELARELESKKDKMTRAQLRKLGRVIRSGKTGPIRAERKTKKKFGYTTPLESFRRPLAEGLKDQFKIWNYYMPLKDPKQLVASIYGYKPELRGIRDPRTSGGRLIGTRRIDSRTMDRSKQYKSARDEALIQMRINETTGVKDAKAKAEKEIKEIRISEAQKALNLKLQKETAEKTAEALKAKNAGLTHSYNVNVRNQTASTLLGSNPEELNKLLKMGGGLSLIKTMIRKGEIGDVSTISLLNVSAKQKENLVRLFNEGGEYIEGQEYFFRTLDDFGRTITKRGYLNKGGDRKDNLELMYIRPNEDGTTTTERYLVPKVNIIKPDDYTSTTSSGKRQKPIGERVLSDAELDLFKGEGVPIQKQRSLVVERGAGLDAPSPFASRSILEGLERGLTESESGGEVAELTQKEFEEKSKQLEELARRRFEELEFQRRGGDVDIGAVGSSSSSSSEEEDLGSYFSLENVSRGLERSLLADAEREQLDTQLDAVLENEADEIARQLGDIREPEPQPELRRIEEEEEEEEEPLRQSAELGQSAEVEPLRQSAEVEPLGQSAEVRGPTSAKREEVEPKPKQSNPSGKKVLTINEEVDATFSPQQKTLGYEKPPNIIPIGWTGEETIPEEVIKTNWDMRGGGLRERLETTQKVPEGYVAIYSTTHGDFKGGKTNVLLVNESDIYYLVRGIRGLKYPNDNGFLRPIPDKSLKDFYKKSITTIRNGKIKLEFNNKQLLRAFGLLELPNVVGSSAEV